MFNKWKARPPTNEKIMTPFLARLTFPRYWLHCGVWNRPHSITDVRLRKKPGVLREVVDSRTGAGTIQVEAGHFVEPEKKDVLQRDGFVERTQELT